MAQGLACDLRPYGIWTGISSFNSVVSGRLQQFLSGGGRDRQFLIFIRNL